MRRLSTTIKISLALALLTTSILVVAELIGIVPNESSGILEGRKKFSESLAIQVSAAATHNDTKFIAKTLDTVVQRNADVLSVVLLSRDKRTLASAGNHALHWIKVPFEKSTPTHVQVPIFKLDELWGTLQVSFAPLEEKTTLLSFFDSFIGLLLFVGLCGFLLFILFIKKVLRELDPGAVIPERVKSAFNALAEGLVILDEKQQIILANDMFAEKVHRTPDKLIGRRAAALNWAVRGGRRKTDYPWELCLREEKRQIGSPLRFKAPDHKVRTFMVNSAPIFDARGIIRGVLATFDDITDLEKKHEQLKQTLSKLHESKEQLRDKTLELEYLATRDPLSGCLNRRAFLEKYEAIFFDASETKSNLVCIMADIDHFKSINDRFGHVAGDKVIQLIAEILRSNSRPEDLVGRYGGEEFCMVLPNSSLEEGVEVAERLRTAIQNDSPIRFTSTKRVTVSIGVAGLSEEVTEPADLINQADQALYAAKEKGRNQVARWDPRHGDDNDNKSVSRDVDATSDAAPKESYREQPEAGGNTTLLQQRVSELEMELEHNKEVIEQKSGLDKLTGLPNRILFTDRINQALVRSQRQNDIAALVSLDIDAFKRVNDALGHLAGDQLLKTVADRIVGVLRSVDTVAVLGTDTDHSTISRLSNDEFGILITDLPNAEPVTWIVKRILDSITERLIIDEHEILVTCSAGVSLYPHDAKDAEGLLRNAGTARNAAKRRFGRNNVRFFSSDLNKASYRQLWLEGQLYRALENDELALRYQPKIDLKTGQVKAMEALVRWRHPKLGLISPKDFIPTAEHTGLIEGVSEWVMRSACEQAQKWIEQGFTDLSMAINLSNVQLRDKGLAEDILSILDKTELSTSHMELEITETTMMENFSVALDTINRLHDEGVRFAIDDFGTGYSSLSCLKILPVDSVKIDRSFLSETFPLEQDQLIIAAIISMSHSMGLRVVAEGVETRAQLGLLRNMGCDEVQGYLFSEPLSAEKATQFLLKHSPSGISFAA